MAQLQRSGYLGVKQGDPSALVVTGGVSRADVGFVSTLIDELNKLPGAATSRSFFDEVGVHPYSDERSPLVNSSSRVYQGQFGTINANFGGIDAMTKMLDSKNRSDAHLWLGEFGYSTTTTWMQAVPDSRRALFLLMAANLIRNNPRVSGLIWFGFLPYSAMGAEWSIMTLDGTPSRTFMALRSADPSSAPRSYPAVGSAPCVSATLSGTTSWAAACLNLPASAISSYEVYVDGTLAASGTGSTAKFDTTRSSNGTHRIALGFFTSGAPIYVPDRSITISNGTASPSPGTSSVSSTTVAVRRLTSGAYRAEATVFATPAIDVASLTIAVRSSSGANYDFPGYYSGATITPTGTLLQLTRSLPKGTYTCWVAYQSGTKWFDLSNKTTFTV